MIMAAISGGFGPSEDSCSVVKVVWCFCIVGGNRTLGNDAKNAKLGYLRFWRPKPLHNDKYGIT